MRQKIIIFSKYHDIDKVNKEERRGKEMKFKKKLVGRSRGTFYTGAKKVANSSRRNGMVLRCFFFSMGRFST